jgi:hypothetical protein
MRGEEISGAGTVDPSLNTARRAPFPDGAARVTLRSMSKIIHRRKTFGGTMTAAEVHAELAWWRNRCSACGGPPAMRIQVFLFVKDLAPEARAVAEIEIAAGRLHTVPYQQGPALRTAKIYACSSCKATAQRVIARQAPSYAIVDIDEGPGPDSPIVGVPVAL